MIVKTSVLESKETSSYVFHAGQAKAAELVAFDADLFQNRRRKAYERNDSE